MDKFIKGKNIILRDVEVADAEYVLSLRTNQKKSLYLHPTANDIEKQRQYIRRYKTLDNEWYFIIESLSGKPLGTVRIYDILEKEKSFCWGSWLIDDSADITAAMESAILVYKFGFEILGFHRSHFDVRKENSKVIRFHKTLGAKQTYEDEDNYYFIFSGENYENLKERFAPFFP